MTWAGQGRPAGENDALSNLAVAGDVGACHEQAALIDAGHHAASLGAGVHGYMLADHVVLADLQEGRLAAVLQILRQQSQRGEGMDDRPRTDSGPPREGHV